MACLSFLGCVSKLLAPYHWRQKWRGPSLQHHGINLSLVDDSFFALFRLGKRIFPEKAKAGAKKEGARGGSLGTFCHPPFPGHFSGLLPGPPFPWENKGQGYSLKTPKTSLNKESRPFLLGDRVETVFPLFLPLAIAVFGGPEG